MHFINQSFIILSASKCWHVFINTSKIFKYPNTWFLYQPNLRYASLRSGLLPKKTLQGLHEMFKIKHPLPVYHLGHNYYIQHMYKCMDLYCQYAYWKSTIYHAHSFNCKDSHPLNRCEINFLKRYPPAQKKQKWINIPSYSSGLRRYSIPSLQVKTSCIYIFALQLYPHQLLLLEE